MIREKLFMLAFICLPFAIIAQNNFFKASIKEVPFDNFLSSANLDNTYQWSFVGVAGLLNLGLEYQWQWNKNISLKPQLGFSKSNINFAHQQDLIFTLKSYQTNYLSFGLIANYHFKENHRGFQIGVGPSFFSLVSHKLSVHQAGSWEGQESEIRDRYNTLPIRLQFEFSYSFNFIKLNKALIDLEFGLTPALKLKGFINDHSSSRFIYQGTRIGLNILFRAEENKEE